MQYVVRAQVGDGTKAATESAVSPILNFSMVTPAGDSSDYPFRYGVTADLGQTVYSNSTVHGLMVSPSWTFCGGMVSAVAADSDDLQCRVHVCCSRFCS